MTTPPAPEAPSPTPRRRHLSCLRTFSTAVTHDPAAIAQGMAEHNNEGNGAALDYATAVVEYPPGTRTVVAWVYDQQDMPGARDPENWYGPDPGGETVVCWWAPLPDPCDACDGRREFEVCDKSTDAVLRWEKCPACKGSGASSGT